MNPSSDETPRGARSSIRMNARLDAATRAKVDALAGRFHRPRAAVVCHIMKWGLGQGESEGPVRHLYLYVDVALHTRVGQAAAALGIDVAPWLRHMVRQVTMTDFPHSIGFSGRQRSLDCQRRLPRYVPCAPSSQLRNLSENTLNNISRLKVYH